MVWKNLVYHFMHEIFKEAFYHEKGVNRIVSCNYLLLNWRGLTVINSCNRLRSINNTELILEWYTNIPFQIPIHIVILFRWESALRSWRRRSWSWPTWARRPTRSWSLPATGRARPSTMRSRLRSSTNRWERPEESVSYLLINPNCSGVLAYLVLGLGGGNFTIPLSGEKNAFCLENLEFFCLRYNQMNKYLAV